jgi:hypothetical protein
MKDVKNALIVSGYYPKILPPVEASAQPVTRLTPHFHDITLENVTAIGSESAGAFIGLKEAPIPGVVFRHVKIDAKRSLTLGYAEISGQDVKVQVREREPVTKQAGAQITLR